MKIRPDRAAPAPDAQPERIERAMERVIGRRGLQPRSAAYLVMALWMIAIIAFGVFQRIADPQTYPTIWLAWWWAIQTVTTVGYGDNVPQQAAGKVVASILMVGGLAFLSIVTATITSSFVARRQEAARARGDDPLMQQLARLSEQVTSLEAQVRRERASSEELGPRSR
jgi:voltage-gated potassium channel